MVFKSLSSVKPRFFVKTGLLAVSLVAAATLSQASQAETLPMFGVRLALAEAKFSGFQPSSLNSASTTGYGFMLGVTSGAHRVYADLNFYSWDTADTRTIHANYDYIWRSGKAWQVFTGVYGGLVDLETAAVNKYQSGPSAGVQAGVLLPLGTSGWNLETGLRYGGFSAKLLNPDTNQEVKIKTQAEGFISLNFSS